jgi:hypothetical protein
MTIKDLHKALNIDDRYISRLFNFKNVLSFRNSSAKKRYEKALIEFYELIIKKNDKR